MTIILLVSVLLVTMYIFGNINLSAKFGKQVKELFTQSKSLSQSFNKSQLDTLPEPVQRYFNHVLKNGQPYISYVRIKHIGKFKAGLNKGWMNIKGEQYATTEKPGFLWKGTTSFFVARDMYIADEGKLIVSLLSLFKVVNAKGEQYNQGELLRWLGEGVMYPTIFLPNDRLKWLPIDNETARLTYDYNGLSLFFDITFDEMGLITQMQTKRYMNEAKLETWVIKLSNYREINNIVIPTEFDVLWRLEEGDFSYAQFIITDIEYDKPEKF